MKLLEQYQSAYDAETAALELRRKGILAQVSEKYSNTHSFASGSLKAGLWVVLDEQFDDACEVLKDADYEVPNPLSEQAMLAIEQAARRQGKQMVLKALNIVISSVILMAMVAYIVFAVLAM